MPSSMINSEFKKLAIIDHTLYHYMIYIFIFYIRKNKLCSIFYINIISFKERKKKKKKNKKKNKNKNKNKTIEYPQFSYLDIALIKKKVLFKDSGFTITSTFMGASFEAR